MSRLDRKRTIAKNARHRRARYRIRGRIAGTAERPRLAVHKSLKYTYAQLIDDKSGQTLVQASSREPEVGSDIEGSGATIAAARAVGVRIAARAKEQGVGEVVFDRGGYVYHGRVKGLAEGAREGGLRL